MPWTDTARREQRRDGGSYSSDLRDAEWALIAPMLPAPRSGDRQRKTCLRRVMNAIMYIASNGGAWQMLRRCFPPVSTVRGYFYV
ncbi:transposase [Novosphingobium sp. TW-4]|uniref:Transposase n=2 Tax=Novosphingobium olei TaxID=2728851 RepID=A0A7Y0BSW1_9SPHN|nr:transposase [Novosphingobium olei]